MTYYVNGHRSQYDPGCSTTTRRYGCTWTSGACGVDAISRGRKRPTPDEVHALLPPGQETNPATPGWSIPDLVRAMGRYGVTLVDRTGDGWEAAVGQLDSGHYIVLQGDSDQFPDSTPSGAFDGDHAIGVHPWRKTVSGETWRWIDDPICPEGRWERESVLRRYATKLWPSIRFGAFAQPVPVLPPKWRWIRKPAAGQPSARFYVYALDRAGVITGRRIETTGTTVQPCTPPSLHRWPGHGPKRLVRLTAGPRKGDWVISRYAQAVP